MIKFILEIANNSFKLGKFKFFQVFSLILLSTIIELIGIAMIIPLISIFLDTNNINEYLEFINFGFLNQQNFLNFILILFLLVFLIKYSLTIVIEYLIVKYTKSWEIDLIMRLIDYHLNRPWIETLKYHESLIKNIVTDIPSFVSNGITGILNISKSFLILSGIIIFLLYQKGPSTIVIFLIFSLIFYFLLKVFKNYLSRVSSVYSRLISTKYNLTDEIRNGLREIKIQNLKNFFLKEFLNNEKAIAKIDIIRKIVTILPKIIIEIISIIGFLLVVYFYAGNSKGLIPLLGLLTFIIYRSQPLLSSLGSLLANIQLYSVQIKSGMNVINLAKKIENIKKDAENLEINSNPNSEIKVNNLDFTYDESNEEKKIFSNLNLSLKFGNIYALAGKNGSGKSTFADLITGLLKPQKGDILFNGQNINLFTNKWMNSISYLSQNYFLFNDTIKNNITLQTKNEGTFYKKRYEQAIEVSNLDEEFEKFEDNDNSFLRDSGKNLSGGQKQRIAIARLIYKNSKVIILDEPTASLDKKSSELMINMLKKLKDNKLIIVISHSQEILNQCDKILNISNRNISL